MWLQIESFLWWMTIFGRSNIHGPKENTSYKLGKHPLDRRESVTVPHYGRRNADCNSLTAYWGQRTKAEQRRIELLQKHELKIFSGSNLGMYERNAIDSSSVSLTLLTVEGNYSSPSLKNHHKEILCKHLLSQCLQGWKQTWDTGLEVVADQPPMPQQVGNVTARFLSAQHSEKSFQRWGNAVSGLQGYQVQIQIEKEESWTLWESLVSRQKLRRVHVTVAWGKPEFRATWTVLNW